MLIQPDFSAFVVLFFYIASKMTVKRDPGECVMCHGLDSRLDFLIIHRPVVFKLFMDAHHVRISLPGTLTSLVVSLYI